LSSAQALECWRANRLLLEACYGIFKSSIIVVVFDRL